MELHIFIALTLPLILATFLATLTYKHNELENCLKNARDRADKNPVSPSITTKTPTEAYEAGYDDALTFLELHFLSKIKIKCKDAHFPDKNGRCLICNTKLFTKDLP